MAASAHSRIPEILSRHEAELHQEWLNEINSSPLRRDDLIKEGELREQTREFLSLVREASQKGNLMQLMGPEWVAVREMLTSVSRSRTLQGFTTSQTATFVLSFKKPLFDKLRSEVGKDAGALAEEVWRATKLLDELALMTTEAAQKAREEVISRQQQELLELSTPVVKLWEGILALPLIGTLDSARTQIVMESLLQKIVETGSAVAIIDITGVPTVDTLVAQHLLKTVTAARLMGADCIISGIRPQIAQTIVHLGVNLSDVVTKSNLADAFVLALKQSGLKIERARSA